MAFRKLFLLFVVFIVCLHGSLAQEKKLGKSGIFKSITFKNKHYFVCSVNPNKYKIELYNKKENKPDVYDFNALYQAKKTTLVFAVNGGMYNEHLHAIGLLISEGKLQKKINTSTGGSGNFNMQPNGVFYISEKNKAAVVTTKTYTDKQPTARCATQSGPMLVIDSTFNTNFTENSANLNIRNGVGVNDNGIVVFVISEEPVNFYEFAQLFRNELKCNNALYLDGAISQYFAPELDAQPKTGVALGPIICVTK